VQELKKEIEKLNKMKLSKNHVPSKALLEQSQVVDKMIVDVMKSKLKGGNWMSNTGNGIYVVFYLLIVILIITPVVVLFLNRAIKKYENEKRKEKKFNAKLHYMKSYNKKGGK